MLPSLLPARRRSLSPALSLREEVDRMFEDWLSEPLFRPFARLEGELAPAFVPRVDFKETDAGLLVTAELPGVTDKDVEVDLLRDRLILKGEKKLETEKKEEGYYRKERQYGAFYREIPLPWEVDMEKVSVDATFKHGVLTVMVPRPKGAKEGLRKIAIHA